jgi:hypothetical protein
MHVCDIVIKRSLRMTDDEINTGIKAVLSYCRQLTLQLARLSSSREPVGVASGFFILVDGETYLISAGHALEKNGWIIETSFTIQDKGVTACIPTGGPWILKRLTSRSEKLQDVDVAWAKVDLAAFQKAVSDDKRLKGKSFEYMVYKGPLDETLNASDPHAYAAANRVMIFDAPGGRYMERDFSYEFEMEYKGTREDGLYVFAIPKHKGHEYYRGASGSPIVEPTGKVMAILVQGCETKNELYAYPTKGLVDLIKIGIDSERRGSNLAGNAGV